MTVPSIEQAFRTKVSEQISLEREGGSRYRVLTPFMLDDGDHLCIVLKQSGDQWILTDEGHTLLHLSYDLDSRSIQEGTRAEIINNALSARSVELREGALSLECVDEQYGDALYDFVQTLLRISDVTLLSRDRVRSTFVDDCEAFLREHWPKGIDCDWHHPQHDPDGLYRVDYRLNGAERPLFVCALHSDAKVSDATISLLKLELWEPRAYSIGLFEDMPAIRPRSIARLVDVCDKTYSSLSVNRDRIAARLGELAA